MRYETATTPLARVVSRKRAREREREREKRTRKCARDDTYSTSIYIYIYILSEAIFSAHRFCEGPPFQKAKHFSTSDGNSKKSVSSLRIYIYICVCALTRARESNTLRRDVPLLLLLLFAMLFYIHPSASTSSQEVAISLFTATYEFDLCFGTNVQSAFGLPKNISLTLIQSSTLSDANKVSISSRPK